MEGATTAIGCNVSGGSLGFDHITTSPFNVDILAATFPDVYYYFYTGNSATSTTCLGFYHLTAGVGVTQFQEDLTTHFISISPVVGSTTATTTFFGADIYINPDDYDSDMYLSFRFDNQTNSFAGGSALDSFNTAFSDIQIPVVSGLNSGSYYRGRNIYSGKVDANYTLNTNWISEIEYEYLSELIESSDVYILKYYPQKTIQYLPVPIIITDTNYEIKTAIRDQLFNVTMNYKMSVDTPMQGGQ